MLGALSDYAIGQTRMIWAKQFVPGARLHVKLEGDNPTGSIKARTAYYVLQDALQSSSAGSETCLVESTSGNFGIALAWLAKSCGMKTLCLVDETMAPLKRQKLTNAGAEIELVHSPDGNHRRERIKRAAAYGGRTGFYWCNQYGNPANVAAHEHTTGVEILEQTDGRVSVVVCALGTGGTVCGVAQAMKKYRPDIQVIAVEPMGSTAFGGAYRPYFNSGAGLPRPSGILQCFGEALDLCVKVDDRHSIATAARFAELEKIGVGVSAGMALAAAERIAAERSNEIVVAVIPDGAEAYESIIAQGAPWSGAPLEFLDAKQQLKAALADSDQAGLTSEH